MVYLKCYANFQKMKNPYFLLALKDLKIKLKILF